MTAPRSLRVLVVAGDALSRSGLAAVLAPSPELTIVGQIEPTNDLQPPSSVFQPDVVLWDLPWPDPDDFIILSAAVESVAGVPGARLPVVALVGAEENTALAWRSGVQGILSRGAPVSAVSAALRAASDGLVVFQPRLLTYITGQRDHALDMDIEPLTPREEEVLGLLAQGYANKAIARAMGITEHTVKFHVNAILAKLGVQSRTEAVVVASRAGLVRL